MYAKSIAIYGFKCFGKAEVEFRYPGRSDGTNLEHPNINLILGDNGRGKSSVLRAIAIAALAPALITGGFVAYRLVRRDAEGGVASNSLLKLLGILDESEWSFHASKPVVKSGRRARPKPLRQHEFLARLKANPRSQVDQLTLESTPDNPISDVIYDDSSPAFFVVGYGATRRVESGSFSPSSEDKRRGRRYQRVASLFEDHVAMRPLQSWFPSLSQTRKAEVIELLSRALPDGVQFSDIMDGDDYVFSFDGVPTPFPALSDGYKAFIGWVSDLLGHMTSVAEGRSLADLSGIILVDEIDLHLHPTWQRDVVARLARAFPRFQFVFTSHSPLVAASVQSANVVVTGIDSSGLPNLERMTETLYGRSIEAVLMSPYFGLDSARPTEAREATTRLAAQVAATPGGDVDAAEAFLRQLADPLDRIRSTSPRSNQS
jgi:AAA domain, putative AbiEii toxin, Type IV TA system